MKDRECFERGSREKQTREVFREKKKDERIKTKVKKGISGIYRRRIKICQHKSFEKVSIINQKKRNSFCDHNCI